FQIPQELDRDTTYEDLSITSPEERKKHFGQYDHVRVYGKDYFDKLKTIGFQVEEVKSSDIATLQEIERYRLSASEILPICRKQ
ncbi:MAG: SAM-dependent methyltransferase, partial [Flavicella sp.]